MIEETKQLPAAKLIRGDLDVAPNAYGFYGEQYVEANSTVRTLPRRQRLSGREIRTWNYGTVLSFPDAWKLVRQGVAIPHNEQCREAAGLTPAQMAEMQARYDKLVEDGSYMQEIVSKESEQRIIDEDEDV